MTIEDVRRSIVAQDTDKAVSYAKELLESGMTPDEIYWTGIFSAVFTAEKDLEGGNISLPVLIKMVKVSEDVREAVGFKKPDLGKAVTCTVDSHTNGRTVMTIFLGILGFTTHEMSVGVREDDIMYACEDPDVTACSISASLCTPGQKIVDVLNALKKSGIRDRIIFNAGGTPITRAKSEEMGCDVYSESAAESAKMIAEKVMDRKGIAYF